MSEQDKMTEQETEVTTSGEAPQEYQQHRGHGDSGGIDDFAPGEMPGAARQTDELPAGE